MLGLTGALAFPFLFLPPAWRLLPAAILLAAVEVLRPAFFGPAFSAWFASGIGGPWGTVPLAAIPMAASALGEVLRERPWPARVAAAGLTGLALAACGGLASALLAPPNKHLLTLSYTLLTTGAASLALAALEAGTSALRDTDFPLLGPLGRNPLLAYMAGGVLTLALRAFAPAGLSAGPAWLSSLAVLGLVAGLCVFLDARKAYLRL
jgi:predicted acyltransferase